MYVLKAWSSWSSIDSSFFGFKAFKTSTCFSPWSSIVFLCFSKALPREKQVNFACSIIYFWLKGNITSTEWYLYLPISSDNKADIFATSLPISY